MVRYMSFNAQAHIRTTAASITALTGRLHLPNHPPAKKMSGDDMDVPSSRKNPASHTKGFVKVCGWEEWEGG